MSPYNQAQRGSPSCLRGTSVVRALTVGFSQRVLQCWGAAAWVVCFGAPMGSLLLTPGLRAQLRIAFYLLAVAQFVGFAILKIRSNVAAWLIAASSVAVTMLLLLAHYRQSQLGLRYRGTPAEELSLLTLKKRLFVAR